MKKSELPEKEYLSALKQDLLFQLEYVQNRSLQSIFMVALPSLMSGDFYSQLFKFINEHIHFDDSPHDPIEITLEANPGAVDFDKFQSFETQHQSIMESKALTQNI